MNNQLSFGLSTNSNDLSDELTNEMAAGVDVGMSCVDVDHYEAVDILKAAGPSLVVHFIREITRLIPPSTASVVSTTSTEPRPKSPLTDAMPVLPPKPAPRLSIGSSSSLPGFKEVERTVSNGVYPQPVQPNPAPRFSFTQQMMNQLNSSYSDSIQGLYFWI